MRLAREAAPPPGGRRGLRIHHAPAPLLERTAERGTRERLAPSASAPSARRPPPGALLLEGKVSLPSTFRSADSPSARFASLLFDLDVAPETPWAEVSRRIERSTDPRAAALATAGERKQCFNEYKLKRQKIDRERGARRLATPKAFLASSVRTATDRDHPRADEAQGRGERARDGRADQGGVPGGGGVARPQDLFRRHCEETRERWARNAASEGTREKRVKRAGESATRGGVLLLRPRRTTRTRRTTVRPVRRRSGAGRRVTRTRGRTRRRRRRPLRPHRRVRARVRAAEARGDADRLREKTAHRKVDREARGVRGDASRARGGGRDLAPRALARVRSDALTSGARGRVSCRARAAIARRVPAEGAVRGPPGGARGGGGAPARAGGGVGRDARRRVADPRVNAAVILWRRRSVASRDGARGPAAAEEGFGETEAERRMHTTVARRRARGGARAARGAGAGEELEGEAPKAAEEGAGRGTRATSVAGAGREKRARGRATIRYRGGVRDDGLCRTLGVRRARRLFAEINSSSRRKPTPFLVPSLSAPPADRRRLAIGHVSMAAAPSEAWSFSSTGSAG